ncbi:uncharacterized protein LOC134218266 [Armigeres subalbatus]|uniref:uncharacterized protein LOC134218266 n=1 Tax=Armigeres subalbatus TaxID=124917 RepID=UPI002ED44723
MAPIRFASRALISTVVLVVLVTICDRVISSASSVTAPSSSPGPTKLGNVNGTKFGRYQRVSSGSNRRNESCAGKYCDEEEDTGEIILGGSRALRQEGVLKHSSVLYGLISIAERGELSDRCYDEMQQIYEGIKQKEIWALKVLDSSGIQEAGFMWGHNHWIGSEQGCLAAQTPLSITLSDRYRRNMKPNLVKALAPFDVGFRMVYAQHQSAWQVEMKFLSENILHIGVCVPQSCSNGELFNLTERFFEERIIQAQDIFEFRPNVLQVKDLQLTEEFWSKPSLFIISITVALTAIMVYLAQCREQKGNEEKPSQRSTITPSEPPSVTTYSPTQMNGHYSAAPKAPSNGTVAPNDDERMKETTPKPKHAPTQSSSPAFPPKDTFMDKVIDSFNVRRNLATVFRTDIGPQSLPVICGFKSICCFLILCFHMQWYTFFTIQNSALMFHYAEQVRYQIISNAPLLVDVFFAISGFLVTYNFVRNPSKIQEVSSNSLWQNAKLYGKMLLHRYLRLSPLYLMITAVGELMTSYVVEKSKFWVHERTDLRCQQYWWRNVLYIQNLYNIDDLCLNWTWSLACEMQYYMISVGLLFVYAKNAKLGKSIYVVFAAATFVFNMAITLMYHFVPSYDVLYNTGSALYVAPWARMSPYVVGVYFGWFLAMGGSNLQITEKQYRKYWILACVAVFISMHSTFKRNFPYPLASTVMVMVRIFVAWAACWTIIATSAGYSNAVTRFLSSKFFIHTNKLTYAIYLINPLIITAVFGLSDGSANADPIPTLVMALGVTVLSYLAAVAFTVLFEIPYCIISNEILKLNKKPPSSAVPASSAAKQAAVEETLSVSTGESKKLE